MRIENTLFFANGPKTAVALGFFDGVHLGHRAVLGRMVKYAGAHGLVPGVFTFRNGKSIGGRIYPYEKKHALLASLGVDICFEPEFSAFSGLAPAQFADLLRDGYGATAVFCGWDFRFGKGRAGDTAMLAGLCAERGMAFEVLPPTELDGNAVSSSRIRRALGEGEMELAGRLLGEVYSLQSEVRHGQGLGHTLGFPTINQRLEEGLARPRYGVYVSRTCIGGKAWPSATGFGTRPTVDKSGQNETCETFIPGFSGDLYGHSIEVELHHFLVESRAFSGPEELACHVQGWARQAQEYFEA